MNRVAITGATGLLGQHLIEKFRQENVEVIAVHRANSYFPDIHGVTARQADITDSMSLLAALEGADTVIHAAGNVSFNPHKRKEIYAVNVQGTRRVVDACLHLHIPNLIHVSSVAALGRKSGILLNEESKWIGGSTSDYAESKYRAELEVFRGAEEGLTISMVNPSVILSGADSRSSGSLFEYVWNENAFYTNGVLNYVDARDVAAVIYQLYKRPRPGERFILNAGEIPYRDFFTRVAQQFGKRAPNHLLSSRLAFWAGLAEEWRARLLMREPLVTRQSARMAIQSYRYDTSKVSHELNYQFRSLEESLRWCCEDFLRNVTLNK